MKKIVFGTPIGSVFVLEDDGKIIEVGVYKENIDKGSVFETSKLLERAKTQILEYFFKGRKEFDLPLEFIGTDFQKTVWKSLQNIEYGKTITYKQLAKNINNEKAVRAVGNANNKNNFLIVVPCHRVIGSNGKLVGYAEGIEIKDFLLKHEKNNS